MQKSGFTTNRTIAILHGYPIGSLGYKLHCPTMTTPSIALKNDRFYRSFCFLSHDSIGIVRIVSWTHRGMLVAYRGNGCTTGYQLKAGSAGLQPAI